MPRRLGPIAGRYLIVCANRAGAVAGFLGQLAVLQAADRVADERNEAAYDIVRLCDHRQNFLGAIYLDTVS